MKKLTIRPGVYMLFTLCGLAVLLSSCLKDSNTEIETSNLMVVNACPSAITGIVWGYNGSLVQDTSEAIPYATVKGYYQQLAKGATITSYDRKLNSITGGYAPGGDANYSLFVTGSADSSFIVKDEYTTPATGKAALRFIQASKGAGSVNVSAGSASMTNIPYSSGQTPAFNSIDPGTAMTISVSDPANTSVPLAQITFTPQAGKVYTACLTGDKLKTGARSLRIFVYDHTITN